MENSLHKSTLTFHCTRIEQNGWEEIILFDEATGAKATIIPSAGGILNAFETNHQGRPINIIDGFVDAADWKKNVNNGHKVTGLSDSQIIDIIAKRDGIQDKKTENKYVTTPPVFNAEAEIKAIKADMVVMKKDIKEILECMKAVYEFETAESS